MADAPEQDQALEQIKRILGVKNSPEDVPTSEEVVQVVMLLLTVIADVNDGAEEATRQSGSNAITAARRLIDAAEKRLSDEVRKLQTWKSEMSEFSFQEDIDDALDRCSDNAEQIKKLRRMVQDITASMPKDGTPGLPPEHEWNGTLLRFKKPDGSWGEWVNLQGMPGVGEGGGFGMGPFVSRIRAGTGLRVSGDGHGDVLISLTGDSPGGGGYDLEEPSGTVDDSNTAFVFSEEPTEIVANGMSYRKNHGWSWDLPSLTATLNFPVGTGGDIYGRMQ